VAIELISTLGEKWPTLSIEEKAEVLHIMTKKILLGKNGKDKPKIEWNRPWDASIQICPTKNAGYARRDSNPRPSDP
jgi:hypothetical protein